MKFDLSEPIAILGYGVEGQYALAFLREQGYSNITICDQNPNLVVPEGFKVVRGENAFDVLTPYKTLVRSPGVRFRQKGVSKAMQNGARVTSMTKLTLEIARERLTAITGSNGKTTTTALAAAILRQKYGERLLVGGNDGTPVLSLALQKPDSPVLLETSSFQFEDAPFSPHISAVLNITPNHLDWHATMDEYIAAKENMLRHQTTEDWAVLNAEDENTAKLSGSTPAKIVWVGAKRGERWLRWHGGRLEMGWDGRVMESIEMSALKVKTHPSNILFAVAIGLIHEVPMAAIESALKAFKGVAHRLEFIGEINGVSFYNDSSCTTPESTFVAMQAFDPKKLILFLGGSSKKSDFGPMAREIARQGVRVYLYGTEAAAIGRELRDAGGGPLILADKPVPPRYNKDMDRVLFMNALIDDVLTLAKPGDAVVLSPACASFDLFFNAKERGVLFTNAVKERARS